MLLNCDLGESLGNWTMGADADVMPYIDLANIACGYHAGDPVTIRRTLALAAEHGVVVGAHPAYPDLVGFGRRSMRLSPEEIVACLHYQVGALDGMAQSAGITLTHVKPHGALYHDMMVSTDVFAAILQAMASYHRPLALVMQASGQAETHREAALAAGVNVLFEAFADRRYADDGSLVQRGRPGAVLSGEDIVKQVSQLQQDSAVTTLGGGIIPLQVDTLCVHGDNPEGVRSIAAVRALLHGG